MAIDLSQFTPEELADLREGKEFDDPELGDCDDIVAEWILEQRGDAPPGVTIRSFEEFQAFLRKYGGGDDDEPDAET